MASPSQRPQASQHEASEHELAFADEFGQQLTRFMRLLHRYKAHVTNQGEDGIEQAAYGILFCLVHEGSQRTSRLAELMHSEVSTVSRQTSSLVQHGLVRREADPQDGRACLLAPTDEGQRVFDENRRMRNRWLAAVLADWPEHDRQMLTTLFQRFNSDVEEHIPTFAEHEESAKTEGEHE